MKAYVFIISLLATIFSGTVCYGQDEAVPLERKKDYVPSAVYLSADFVSLYRDAFFGQERYEFRAKVDIDRYFLAVDFGKITSNLDGSSDSLNTRFEYTNEGWFYKIGPQINFLPYNPDRSNLYFSIMYARAFYEDHVDYTIASDEWGQSNLSFSNNAARASWYEISLGMSARVYGPIFVGYTMRFKLAKENPGTSELNSYEIPGFGRAKRNSNLGFSYYITYRLGWRDKPVPQRPPKKKRFEKKKESEPQRNRR